MTVGPALPCPSCKRVLEAHSWDDANGGLCRGCQAEFEFFPFPALTAVRTKAVPQSAVLAEDSVCFFHAENRAESICEDCGRLLCSVCTVEFGGRKQCPSCIAASKSSDAAPAVRGRTLYDGIALSLALLPLLVWPLTAVTSGAALGMVIYGWKKPGSIVRGTSRVRLIVAGFFALCEIIAWISGILYFYVFKE
jgi:hypothetical protein